MLIGQEKERVQKQNIAISNQNDLTGIKGKQATSWVSLQFKIANATEITNLLKFATMIGIGRVMHKTPQIAHREATSLPAAVFGEMSP